MINYHLLGRVLTQPWAMRNLDLAVMTQMLILPRPESANVDADVKINVDLKNKAALTTLGAALLGQAAIIPIHGCIGRGWDWFEVKYMGCVDVDDLMAAIDALPEGQPVVLWFRSPGGIVTGVPEFAEYLREAGASRRIIAWTDDLCCSAAYWLAAQCEAIYATPTATLGSIGVYLAFYDWTQYLENAGIKLELFKAGRMKAMGLRGNPLSPEESELLQASVMEIYAAFTADVTARRAIDSETMQGQTFRGPAALALNLCDGFFPSSAAFFAAMAEGRV